MFNLLKEFFEQHIAPSGSASTYDPIPVATAALLVEVMLMDGNVDPVERAAVLRAVRGSFKLAADDAEAVIRLAEGQPPAPPTSISSRRSSTAISAPTIVPA